MCLEPETGITWDLFMAKPEGEDGDNPNPDANMDMDGEVNESQQIAKEVKLKTIIIPEVVREKRLKFFKEPRLGCYYAIDISYKSSLSKEVNII